MIRLGIDLGGTKIELIALDDASVEQYRRRVPTPPGDYAATLAAIVDLVKDAEERLGAGATVGIGIPGTLSLVSGKVKNANSTCLIGRPLKEDLEARLAREVRLANDANCFALSEAIDGAGRGAGTVFGVILGTGVGGGIVVNGKVLTGPNGIAGEWGHNPLPLPGLTDLPLPVCYCRRAGCIETYLSGPGMVNDHERATGVRRETHDIVAGAKAGEGRCMATLTRYEERLARSLASVINILDPDVIVLGGGMSNIMRLYNNVARLWGAYVFSDHVETRLVQNAHGDTSGVRGAAWLWGDT